MAGTLLCGLGSRMLMYSLSTLFSCGAGDNNAKLHSKCAMNLGSQRKNLSL